MTLEEFYQQLRTRLLEIARQADHDYERLWGCDPSDGIPLWFGSLANALNDEMRRNVPPSVHLPLLLHIENALDESEEVDRCIDASFVENLFGWVGPLRSSPYWEVMPDRLKELFLRFHARTPTA